MTERGISRRQLVHGGFALWTVAFIGYDAYLWYAHPGWEEAARNTINFQSGGPVFLPVLLPVSLWLLAWLVMETVEQEGGSDV